MSTVGERIKERRKALGLTADDLATRIGKDRSMIFRYEKGEIENMPVAVIGGLAEALEVSPCYLMGWERSAEKPSRQFRSAIRDELEATNNDDIKAAVDNGTDIAFLSHIAYGEGTLSFDDAHKAADELGTTISDLLGEESQLITSDGPAAEFIVLFNRLGTSQQKAIVAAIQAFLSTQESFPADQE